MQITHWNPTPIHTIRYRYARKGGGATEVGTLAITTAVANGLPASLGGLVLTADLQGRELIAPKPHHTAPHRLVGREGKEMLGEVAARELARVCADGLLPEAGQLGVVLAGDFWSEPGSTRRGGIGGVGPAWGAFRERFRWAAGVLGNHDRLDAEEEWGLDVCVLDGDVVELDGLRIGGVGGIIGHPDKWQRKSETEFRAVLADVLAEAPDLVVLHGGPDVPEFGCLGHPAIREVLLDHPPTLVVCGHCYWPEPLRALPNGTQVANVDSRLIVLCNHATASTR
jgi:hypothetical protein